jgi:4-hydroxybutyrate CoA-transferase
MRLLSGLQLGDYPFLDAVERGALRFDTWHVHGPARRGFEEGWVGHVPCRASEVPRLLRTWGTDTAFVRLSPPDRNGYLSLGPSVSYPLPALLGASTVIAEIDPTLPRTHGQSYVHRSQLTALVDSDEPAPEYPAAIPDEISIRIAERILQLLPREPVLQVGIGSIPEALVSALPRADLGAVRFAGMATDAMVPLFDSGTLRPSVTVPDPAILAVELMGTRRLLDAAHDHPAIGVYPSTVAHTPTVLAQLDRFVSINSAIEVDLGGQVNAEMLRGRQVSSVGGAYDFVEAGLASSGGLRITALPATAARGQVSRIVPRLPDAVATIPRHAADLVVTEHGVADLRGRTLRERAEALIAIADPAHQAVLSDHQTLTPEES